MSGPSLTLPTPTGGTVTLVADEDDVLVVLDHPRAPTDMRHHQAGRVIDGGFQPHPFGAYGLTPATLRVIADAIDEWEA